MVTGTVALGVQRIKFPAEERRSNECFRSWKTTRVSFPETETVTLLSIEYKQKRKYNTGT